MQQGAEAELKPQGYGNKDPFTGAQKDLHSTYLMQEAIQSCCNGKNC